MIDGLISDSSDQDRPAPKFEAIRFQPFFLSSSIEKFKDLKGRGMFDRGLHFRGNVTNGGIRSICTCDECLKSFTLLHFHSGFSYLDYFYSKDGQMTLTADAGELGSSIEEMNETLAKNGYQDFNYYNPLKCPHCKAPFIDFEKFRDLHGMEYYGHYHSNSQIVKFKRM